MQATQAIAQGAKDTEIRLDALVIGAGFSGLYQLHCLRERLGMSVVALEAGDGVGGTWYWNRYPGARCDSESQSYCYTFSPELLREWEWTERYPAQPEILRYLEFVADRLDLRRSIRFGCRVTGAHYDEAHNVWRVDTAAGVRYVVTYLIAAVGCLSSANVPQLPGLADFAGRWVHTGQWPAGGVDFRGQRVGLVGTGATGIQAAPVIAEQAQTLTVFQRTANYSIPARNVPLTAEFRQYVREHYDEIKAVMHGTANGHPFPVSPVRALDVSAEERRAAYEAAWQRGGLRFRATFHDLLSSQAANDTAADFIRGKIREIVRDPATAETLTNIDHPFASKRPPIDSGYFETFNRPNVQLVDLRREPLEAVVAEGLRTSARTYPLDILVFATGFDALTGPLLRLNLTGRGGLSLAQAWAQGPRTYLGLQMAGFPNLFTVTGPGSPSVLCNMPVAIEQHVDWITECIAMLRARGVRTMEPLPEAEVQWGEEVERAADATLLPMAGHSWYLGANVPGKPRRFMPYAGGMAHYRRYCAEVVRDGYRGFRLA